MSSPGSRLRRRLWRAVEIRKGKNNQRKIRKIKLMKNRSSLKIFTTILSVFACFGLLSGARAADEGDLGGGNTNEGARALSGLTSGGFNTGLGWFSLFTDSDA